MNKKENRGITLVALVITIIVLIILAGVSINAVMNDGLIGNAKEAKNEYDVAKEKEKIAITDLEVQTDFLKSGTPYLFRNGYLTGVVMDSTHTAENISDVEAKLQNVYTICNIDGSKIEDKNIPIATGMVVKKGDVPIGNVIVYGDINGDGEVDGVDALNDLTKDSQDYKKVAADVNFDGFINAEDISLIGMVYSIDINQNVSAQEARKIAIETIQEYYGRQIDNLGLNDKIVKKEWYTENRNHYYKIYIEAEKITVEECLAKNSDTHIIDVIRDDEVITTGKIQNGDILELSKKDKESNIAIISYNTIAEFVVGE